MDRIYPSRFSIESEWTIDLIGPYAWKTALLHEYRGDVNRNKNIIKIIFIYGNVCL